MTSLLGFEWLYTVVLDGRRLGFVIICASMFGLDFELSFFSVLLFKHRFWLEGWIVVPNVILGLGLAVWHFVWFVILCLLVRIWRSYFCFWFFLWLPFFYRYKHLALSEWYLNCYSIWWLMSESIFFCTYLLSMPCVYIFLPFVCIGFEWGIFFLYVLQINKI